MKDIMGAALKKGCDDMTNGRTREILRERIKDERKKRGFSQAKLAALIGVSNASTVANWEGGVSSPDLDTLSSLAVVFDVSLDYLLGLTNTRCSPRGETQVTIGETALTREQIDMIQKYETCDEVGRESVLVNLDYHFRRATGGGADILPKESASRNSIFLSEGDEEYEEMKNCRNELRRLKRASKKSFSEITNFLWSKGYGEELCVAFVIGVFGYGIAQRVPSRELYEDIRAFLQGQFLVVSNVIKQ